MLKGFFKDTRLDEIKQVGSEYVHKDVLIKLFSDVIQGEDKKI